MQKVKLCKNCKWFVPVTATKEINRCGRKAEHIKKVDPIMGYTEEYAIGYTSCWHERNMPSLTLLDRIFKNSSEDTCGPQGKYYKEKK